MKLEEYTRTEQITKEARSRAKRRPAPGECCVRVVVASWKPDSDVQIFDRHTGSRCAGIEEPLNFKEWYRHGR
jgi:hypothetical protein